MEAQTEVIRTSAHPHIRTSLRGNARTFIKGFVNAKTANAVDPENCTSH